LLPEFTALENVAMPLLVRGMKRTDAEEQATQWLREVGLQQRAHHRAGELSGGEQQRVALGSGTDNQAEDSAGGRTDRRPRQSDS